MSDARVRNIRRQIDECLAAVAKWAAFEPKSAAQRGQELFYLRNAQVLADTIMVHMSTEWDATT